MGDDVLKIGQGKALKNKWITKDGAGFIRAVSSPLDVWKVGDEERDSWELINRSRTR